MIEENKISNLNSHLQKLNGYSNDRDQLKKLLNDIIKDFKISGVGLIEIVRKTQNKVLYDFISVDNSISLFSVIVRIPIFNYQKRIEELYPNK